MLCELERLPSIFDGLEAKLLRPEFPGHEFERPAVLTDSLFAKSRRLQRSRHEVQRPATLPDGFGVDFASRSDSSHWA